MPESRTAAVVAAEPPATAVYALGRDPAESARLQRQSDELRPASAALLDRPASGPARPRSTSAAGRAGSSSCSRSGSARAAALSGWTRTRPTSPWPGSSPVSAGWARSRSWRRTPGAPACRRLRSTWCMRAPCWSPCPSLRDGPGRDGPAGPPGRLGRQPGAGRGVFGVLPALIPAGPGWVRSSRPRSAGTARLLVGRRLTGLYRDQGLEDVGVEARAGVYRAGDPAHRPPDLIRSMRR